MPSKFTQVVARSPISSDGHLAEPIEHAECETSHRALENIPLPCNISAASPCSTPGSNTSPGPLPYLFLSILGTLTYFSLVVFNASLSTFETLVDYLPNIRILKLRSFVLEPDEKPVVVFTALEKLYVDYIHPDRLEFFNKFAKLELEYEELKVGSLSSEAVFLESALQIRANTVKYNHRTSMWATSTCPRHQNSASLPCPLGFKLYPW